MRGGRDILKTLAAEIAIQSVLAPIRDKQVGVPVVVVIAGADALTPAVRDQTHAPCDVGEVIAPVIVVEPIAAALAGDNEDIQEAVVVIVQECYPASGGFNNELLRGRAAIRD